MTPSSEHQQPKEYIINERTVAGIELAIPDKAEALGKILRSRPHPAPARTAEHMQPAYAHGVMDGERKAREDVLDIRQEVRRFAELMETKLKKNDHKSHWSKESFTYLFGRLDDEMKELNQAVASAKTNHERIADEAVDVANFLMMIVDNLQSLRSTQQQAGDQHD